MRNKKFITILFLIFCAGTISLAQSNQMLRRQALEAMETKDWYSATQYYNRLYLRDSSELRLQYQYAEASRLNYDYDLALNLYLRIAAYDNGHRYPLTFYWIGQILKGQEKYKEAKKWLVKFNKLKLRKTKYDIYKIKSHREAEACDQAQILINHPLVLIPERLDGSVNSFMSEFAAFEKDSTLYFSSIRTPEKKDQAVRDPPQFSRIYRSELRGKKFVKVKALDTLINARNYQTANSTFNAAQDQMIVSRCLPKNANEYTCDLYLSKLINKKWRLPEKMDKPVNLDSVSTTQPNFAEMNGKTVLFFSSDRPGGEGGLDIWYSVRNEDGSFNPPVNAGKKINSSEDEVTPWYSGEKNTLFFSSSFLKGLGGYDVFKSEFINNEFSEPVNAGSPINTGLNDLYYSVNKGGNHVYITSNRAGSFSEKKTNYCCNDIYRFEVDTAMPPPLPIDSTLILKEEIKLLVPLTLYFNNDEPDPRTKDTVTVKNYKETYDAYKLFMPEYIKQFAKGLKGETRNLATVAIENFFSDSLDVGMDGLEQFTNLLEKVLLSGETVKITMKGYCSPLASTDYNINLAKRRISSLRNYFKAVKNGLFLKYIHAQSGSGAKIIFENVDIGELPASRVSDSFKDIKNSVYSPFAASERKIQIIAISFGGL